MSWQRIGEGLGVLVAVLASACNSPSQQRKSPAEKPTPDKCVTLVTNRYPPGDGGIKITSVWGEDR